MLLSATILPLASCCSMCSPPPRAPFKSEVDLLWLCQAAPCRRRWRAWRSILQPSTGSVCSSFFRTNAVCPWTTMIATTRPAHQRCWKRYALFVRQVVQVARRHIATTSLEIPHLSSLSCPSPPPTLSLWTRLSPLPRPWRRITSRRCYRSSLAQATAEKRRFRRDLVYSHLTSFIS